MGRIIHYESTFCILHVDGIKSPFSPVLSVHSNLVSVSRVGQQNTWHFVQRKTSMMSSWCMYLLLLLHYLLFKNIAIANINDKTMLPNFCVLQCFSAVVWMIQMGEPLPCSHCLRNSLLLFNMSTLLLSEWLYQILTIRSTCWQAPRPQLWTEAYLSSYLAYPHFL